MSLEKNIEQDPRGSWIKRSFKEEWPTMGNHLAACSVSIAAATGFSAVAPEILDSDAAISAIATGLDSIGYWGTLLPQFLYRDRNKIRNNEGELDGRKVKRKAALSEVGLWVEI